MSRISISHPIWVRQRAATRASPALCPFPAKTKHFPACGKNLAIARAIPAPACSSNASAEMPRAKAASSAARICAGVTIGECNLIVGVRRFFLLRRRGRTLFLRAAARAFLLLLRGRFLAAGALLRRSTRTLRLGTDKIVVIVCFPDRRGHGCHAGHDWSIARRRFAHDAVRDPIRQPLTVSTIQGKLRFGRVG